MRFDYQVPYSARGTLLHEVHADELPVWKENEPFYAELKIDWIEPGASIKRVMVLREVGTGTAYPMFVDDIVSLLHKSIVDHGVVSGTWRVKRTGRTKLVYTLVKVED